MDTCDENLLSAFVDGELPPHVRDRVTAHVAQCPKCAAQVDELRAMSTAFASMSIPKLSQIERARLHRELDDQLDAPIWRLGGAIGLIAASILVVAATWLAAIPAEKPTAPGRVGNSMMVAAPSDWEQIAVTQFVPIGTVDDRIYLADSHLDEWMLEALNRSQP